VNPDALNRGDAFLKNVALHELGHSVGFADVTKSSCAGQSIMYQYIIDPPVTSLKTCDKAALRTEYPSPLQSPTPAPSDGGSSPLPYDPCCSPIVVRTTPGPYTFSGVHPPVMFDINADGTKESIGWTADPSICFLALDRNGNNVVDDGAELFGTATPLPDGTTGNGFIALSQYDDNRDGVIDARDRSGRGCSRGQTATTMG